MPMRSYHDDAEFPICAQGVHGGFVAMVLQEDDVAPLFIGTTVHSDPDDALAEAREQSAHHDDLRWHAVDMADLASTD